MENRLDIEHWFDITSTGKLRKKRVGKAQEAQFPREYRVLYQESGSVALMRRIRQDYDLGLLDAWERMKRMFND